MSQQKTLAQRFSETMRPVRHLQEALNHNSDILLVLAETLSEQRRDIATMREAITAIEQRQAVVEAGTGHLMENGDWMTAIIDSQADSMMLIHNFGWLIKNSDDFWRDALGSVEPKVFRAAFESLPEIRQKQLIGGSE